MFRPLWPYLGPDSAMPGTCPSAPHSAVLKKTKPKRHQPRKRRPQAEPKERFYKTPPQDRFTFDDIPVVEMCREVLSGIMFTVGNRPPESGAVLLGPIGEPLKITGYFFDEGAECSQSTYSPDTKTINRLRNEEWLPAGLDWNGFIHSHPGLFDRPSAGDVRYFKKLLKGSDESVLVAPIVIPEQFRFVPYVIRQGHEDRPQYAHLSII